MVSAIGIVYCADVECKIEVKPFSLFEAFESVGLTG